MIVVSIYFHNDVTYDGHSVTISIYFHNDVTYDGHSVTISIYFHNDVTYDLFVFLKLFQHWLDCNKSLASQLKGKINTLYTT